MKDKSGALLQNLIRFTVSRGVNRSGYAGGKRNTFSAYLFLGPALLLLFVFWGMPLVWAFLLSFTDFNINTLAGTEKTLFIGFNNYIELWTHPLFWKAIGNTLYFVLVGGSLTILVSLGAALLIDSQHIRFKGIFSTIFFMPVATTLVAIAVIWRFIYHPRYGWFNQLLDVFGMGGIDWLGDTRWAMPAIILMMVWKSFGYNMIIFLAGLRSIPGDLYAASCIDGASYWQRFRHITMPMLSPIFLFVGLITMIGYLQLFAEPYIMTEGGPLQSTVSIMYLMYEEGFRWWNIGYASAIAFVLFLLFLLGAKMQLSLRSVKF